MLDGSYHGHGMFTWSSSGNFHVGKYENGKRHGPGTEFDKNGKILQTGTWKDGELLGTQQAPFSKIEDCDEGYADITYDDGNRYEGDCKNGARNGHGKITFESGVHGTRYEGNWLDGSYHGQGKFTYVT